MAITEACSLWIEERVREEIEYQAESGLSHREIGRQIAYEIEKIFEAKVNPEAIRKKVDRMSGTTVPVKKNDIKTDEKNDLEKLEKPKHGGARQGAGRKRTESLGGFVESPEQKIDTPRNPQQVVDRIVSLREQIFDQFKNLQKLVRLKLITNDRPFVEIRNQLQLLVDGAADDLRIYITAPEDPSRKAT